MHTKAIHYLLAFCVLLPLMGTPLMADKYASEFLNLPYGARAQALGGAYTAVPGDPFGAFYNPASLTPIHRLTVGFSHGQLLGFTLAHTQFGAVIPPDQGLGPGTWSAYLSLLTGGSVDATRLPYSQDPESINADNYPVVTEVLSYYDVVLWLSHARDIGNGWSIGATAKPIYRALGHESGFGLSVDLGVQQQPKPWLTWGAVLRDAGFLTYSTGKNESFIPALKTGFRVGDWIESFNGELYVNFDVTTRFEGRTTSDQAALDPASFDFHGGLEYTYRHAVSIRLGSDAGAFTAGAGATIRDLTVDVALIAHRDLESSYRITAAYRF